MPAQPTLNTTWPAFPVGDWAGTGPTLHRWTQIVGKLRLALCPPVNHYWHVPLYVSARGLTTSPIPYGSELFELEFDFLSHELRLTASWGVTDAVPLQAQSVAAFYGAVQAMLARAGIHVPIWPVPVELPDTLPFEQDHQHASYDPVAAQAFWRVLTRVDTVFKQFRGAFLGKASPVHVFWGALDLAVTRFSGRHAPLYTGPTQNVALRVMQESYSHEVSSAGFWPGNDQTPPLFYSYAVPQPAGYAEASVRPAAASYSQDMGEFILPYAAVQASDQPDALLLDFLQSTYEAAATLGQWDRRLLEERPYP